ncbi:MAG: hypothetical protein ACR5LD_09880 [Symbiopectobacterium sp.]
MTRHYPLDFMSQGCCASNELCTARLMSADGCLRSGVSRRVGAVIQSPRYGARHWLEIGTLVEIATTGYAVIYHVPAGYFLALRVSVFIDWLRECFSPPL